MDKDHEQHKKQPADLHPIVNEQVIPYFTVINYYRAKKLGLFPQCGWFDYRGSGKKTYTAIFFNVINHAYIGN